MSLRDYHILISHSWDYGDDYRTIKSWLDSAGYFKWSDYSVRIENPIDANSKAELKQRIANRISSCSCVIVLAGMYVAYSEWIDFEIETALRYNKPIIGVRPLGQLRVPDEVSSNADIMVGWTRDGIVSAVRQYAL